MAAALRRSFASLVVSLLAMVVATAMLPPRLRLGSSSIPCETVLRRRTHDLIVRAFCQKAEAYQLRATLAIALLLVVLSFLPLAFPRSHAWPAGYHVLWVAGVVLVAVGAIVLVTAVGVRPERTFLDR